MLSNLSFWNPCDTYARHYHAILFVSNKFFIYSFMLVILC